MLDATVSGGPGSGNADLVFLVNKANIDGNRKAGEDNLILWSRFGLDQGAKANSCGLATCDTTTAESGFEEWSYSAKSGTVINCTDCGNGVPTPGTASMALLALGIMGFLRRSRKTPVLAG